jgi:uncharacterized protein involved in outer membrane biogenesis
MAKFFKFIIVFSALLVVVLAAAGLALRLYLTDDRVRALLIPPTEKALGRTVTIGHIKVSLLSGITLYDFVVKEENGQDNFISSSHISLSYEWLPLLQKKVVVRQIRLVDPTIRLVRDWRGVFNFTSLAFLDKPERAASSPSAAAQGGRALPFSVAVKNFSLENGRLRVQDGLAEIPPTEVVANADVALAVGRTLADLSYQGNLRLMVDTVYKGLPLHNEAKIDFDQDELAFISDLTLERQTLQFSGTVAKVLDRTQLPPLMINVSGREVDVDQLLAGLAVLAEPEAGKAVTTTRALGSAAHKGPLVPPDLLVRGQVRIDKARYQKVTMADFQLNYALDKGVFTISDLTGRTMGGEMRGAAEVRLQAVPSYEGKMGMHGLQLAEIQKTFMVDSPAQALGAMNVAMTFNGSGISPAQMKQNITALGEFSLQNGRITGADFSRSLAALLDLPELKDIDLQEMNGTFAIKKGVAQIRSSTSNPSFHASLDGNVGLDGTLNLPVEMSLSPRLSARLLSRVKVARYMEQQGDRLVVRLAVDGMLASPRISLDSSRIRQQATDTLIDEVLGKDAGPEEKAAGEAVKGLLDSLFGK